MKWPQINFSGHPQYIRFMKTSEKSSCYKSECGIKYRIEIPSPNLSLNKNYFLCLLIVTSN